jgi:hypothetical protein
MQHCRKKLTGLRKECPMSGADPVAVPEMTIIPDEGEGRKKGGGNNS